MKVSKMKIYFWVGGILVVVILGFGLSKFTRKSIDINNKPAAAQAGGLVASSNKNGPRSALAGIACENYDSRPFAVMVSSDKEARPLSGISESDMVFEMPVVDVGFTRMMAVYQCGRPKEVGSVRSSRLDFVPLALGVNAIYAHFGGEHKVLDELNNGIIDNIDGLKYDGTIYYRKKSILRPHNAFTNFDLLTQVSKDLGYNLTDSKIAYLHDSDSKSQGNTSPKPLFNEDFRVTWQYDRDDNAYYRTRSGDREVDRNTGKQVAAKNVIIMKTTWSPINKDYIRVKTVGSGGVLVYKNGTVTGGTWEKKDDHAKLMFYNQNHKEISLAPGVTWIEIDAH